ncbi:MAG: phosphatase PAP2 family protein, partial [Steroidobacteraceae bacterium]|nr:phosphatase PAP2 family protein [Steroidobacteraceae bacterium]
IERELCVAANALGHYAPALKLLRVVSRLGDGAFWYGLIAVMPLLLGRPGVLVAAQMLATGAVGLAIYRHLKSRLVRERPFVRLVGVECWMPPLDRYSFPSGHTLHAIAFTIIAVSHLPLLAILLVPFTVLVAASRVVLGLHYPSDVLAGAALGAVLAWASHGLFERWAFIVL